MKMGFWRVSSLCGEQFKINLDIESRFISGSSETPGMGLGNRNFATLEETASQL